MNLIPTELNQRLANAVRHSAEADHARIAGQAGFWRWLGLGAFLFSLGLATGAGFYGYSFVSQRSENADAYAQALSKALAEVRWKVTAEGTVQIEPRELRLAKDQVVSLDTGARVGLEAGAAVRADGEITVQGPSISSSQSQPARGAPLPAIANFTVFKDVPHGKGSIMTGWTFLTSAQRAPTSQYCYYTESADTPGRNVMLNIGSDEKLEAPKTVPEGFGLVEAFNKCVWFRAESP
jgi:hypothetical protein